jgi:hypothetical protein
MSALEEVKGKDLLEEARNQLRIFHPQIWQRPQQQLQMLLPSWLLVNETKLETRWELSVSFLQEESDNHYFFFLVFIYEGKLRVWSRDSVESPWLQACHFAKLSNHPESSA